MAYNVTIKEVQKTVSSDGVSLLGNICGPLKTSLGKDGCSDDTWACLVITK
jgi:hypothetical protein